MTPKRYQDIVSVLLKRHGRTYASEMGIRLGNTPAPLFQLLIGSLLLSARISSSQAVKAARALFDTGWTTPDKLIASTWEERVTVLNHHGYARYDESTSRMLADTTQLLINGYGGDLRRLRKAANGDPQEMSRLLQAFKGIGPAGAAIFMREVQSVWNELAPFFDERSLEAAGGLGLPASPKELSALVSGPKETALLAASLIRSSLARNTEEIRAEAQEMSGR